MFEFAPNSDDKHWQPGFSRGESYWQHQP